MHGVLPVCCSTSQCVAVCSVLQCVAVCCSVLTVSSEFDLNVRVYNITIHFVITNCVIIHECIRLG